MSISVAVSSRPIRAALTTLLFTAVLAVASPSPSEANALRGGLIGAGGGALFGALVGGGRGAAIGAIVGGVVGVGVGARRADERRARERMNRRRPYRR